MCEFYLKVYFIYRYYVLLGFDSKAFPSHINPNEYIKNALLKVDESRIIKHYA